MLAKNSRSTTLTKEEVDGVREKYKRASTRARRAMVSTFLLQGQTTAKMAKLIGVPEEEVKQHYEDAVEEIKTEMELIPEGPLHVSEVVIEGYSRLVQRILASCEEAQQRIGMDAMVDPKAEMAIQGYMKLSLDAFDKLTDRMEKYGILPMVPKSHLSHGGVRPQNNSLKEDFDSVIARYAEEHGLNLEEETQNFINGAVNK